MSQLPDNKKRDLLMSLFRKSLTDQDDLDEYDEYFESFDKELQYLNSHRDIMSREIEVKQDHLVKIAEKAVPEMRQAPATTQESILGLLQNDPNLNTEDHGIQVDEEDRKAVFQQALYSTIRLWLMIDPGKGGWGDTEPFCNFVHGQFYPGKQAPLLGGLKETDNQDPELAAEMKAESAQLQSSLTHPMTAANLKKLTNIRIEREPLITQHLEFDADIRRLSVFCNNRWLLDISAAIHSWKRQCDRTPPPTPAICPFPIPLEVIDEAIKSLDLIFPSHNPPTNRFLEKFDRRLYLFRLVGNKPSQLRTRRRVRLREFTFYHDRLIELAQEFITPPKDWNTIWRDYRNPIQYWTFWLGLVIFLATVASVALAGAQVYYAQHPVSNG